MIKQLLVPKEFRIPGSEWAADWPTELRRILRAQDAEQQQDPQISHMIGCLSLHLWRARRKIKTSENSKTLRDVDRFLDSAWDAMLEAGVQVTDHTSEHFTGGESFSVLVTEPVEGLTRHEVIETVRPTVYFRGALIQAGQVVVGRPMDSQGGSA